MRVKSLDAFKAIAAYIVILLHYGVLSGYALAVGRIAVPFFFLVSGYFLKSEDEKVVRSRCYKNIKKLVIMVVVVNAFTIIKTMVRLYLNGQTFGELFQKLWSVEFIFFNFKFSSYLWFVRALIIMYAVYAIINHIKSQRRDIIICVCACVFGLLNLVFCKYQVMLFGHELFDSAVYEIPSKFLGTAFVLFSAGWLIKSNGALEKIVAAERNKHRLVEGLVIAVLLCLYYMEVKFLQAKAMDMPNCDYFFTYVTVIAIFIILLFNPNMGAFLSNIGKKYAMWIYILHMNILSIVNIPLRILSKIGLAPLAQSGAVKAFIAYLICIFIAMCILSLWNRIIKPKYKRRLS